MSAADLNIVVLLNERSGALVAQASGNDAEEIARGFAAHGVHADVQSVSVERIPAAVAAAEKEGRVAVVAGGGDGTINAVANAVAGTRLLFGVLPLGTHNHFAKDLGVPTDRAAAVAMLANLLRSGNGVRPLDVAEVNGHLFLNFSGIGLHPKIIRQREQDHAEIKRWPLLRRIFHQFTKPLALLVSFMRTLPDFPVHRLTMVMDGMRRRSRTTPSVIICTNPHQMEVFGVSDISVPRRGVLNTYIACTPTLPGLIRLLLAALTRRLKAIRQFETLAGRTLTIQTRRPTLHVSIDGEILRLKTPLVYRIRPAALRVIADPI